MDSKPINIIQWNCKGSNNEIAIIQQVVLQADIAILCCADYPERSKLPLLGYDIYHHPTVNNYHGMVSAIRKGIPNSNLDLNVDTSSHKYISSLRRLLYTTYTGQKGNRSETCHGLPPPQYIMWRFQHSPRIKGPSPPGGQGRETNPPRTN